MDKFMCSPLVVLLFSLSLVNALSCDHGQCSAELADESNLVQARTVKDGCLERDCDDHVEYMALIQRKFTLTQTMTTALESNVKALSTAIKSDGTSNAEIHSSSVKKSMPSAALFTDSKSPTQGCSTPAGARWCKVTIPGLAPYNMAVYSRNDIVSDSICRSGQWEDLDLASLGAAGEALDIGSNIGYYTVALAKAGWHVTAFEPIAKNVEFLNASLCENPELASKVNLLNIGLGAEEEKCQIFSENTNAGDGEARCGQDTLKPVPAGYEVRSSFLVHRLEDVLAEQNIKKVDFVKIDVEGFECQVFKGAPHFLATYKPRKIHTEVWATLQGCTPADYLNSFSQNGYSIASDEACRRPDKSLPDAADPNGIKNYWVCKGTSMLETDELQGFHKRHVMLKLD